MGTDAIGFSLAILAIGMSMIAVEYRQPILGVGASALWAGFMGFILANTTAGLAWQVITVLGCITFIIAMLFMGFLGRRYRTGKEILEGQQEPSKSFMGRFFNEVITKERSATESPEEYQKKVRRALNRGRERTQSRKARPRFRR